MFAAFLPALIGALAGAMGTLAGRVLIALGLGFVTYKGIDIGVAALKQSVISGVQSQSADIVGLLGFLWVDKALTVVFSAFTVALSMKAIGGSVKKMVAK
ncbi:DUF2523 domain-containing protein [Pseudoduganella sp. FT26W]|uniref:DUF2523 domain-containing protein n=1 Tax=Duganella aquatilis TaxID=2666082 RepID=A0A844DCI4_9BURK|nr:DUF2523 family protein [Duganella aquatilis]MRW85269.1 DUF2523 domain-containing protein [Duganella aquatilis]